jgi:signal peptidase I
MRRRGGHRLLWILAIGAFIVLLFRFFIGDVYPVASGSMRPTIFGGFSHPGDPTFTEHLLVRFDRAATPERYDLVVLERNGEEDPLVKRVVGLPGESIQIVSGDLLIEGELLEAGAGRPELIPLFDDRYLDVERYFKVTEKVWTREDAHWRLDATEVAPGSNGGMLFYHLDLVDGYLDQDHEFIGGVRQVNDGAVECEVMLTEAQGVLRIWLTEEGDTFQARIESPSEGEESYRLVLTRHNRKTGLRPGLEDKVDTLLEEAIPFSTGSWHRLRWSNLDNHLVFDLDDGAFRRTVAYESNEAHGQPRIAERSIIPRAALGGEGCLARVRSIRILRDIFYTERGEQGLRSPLHLGPGQYFVLGDNSGYSADSRVFGPVTAAEIAGTPVAVVWPWKRLRWL